MSRVMVSTACVMASKVASEAMAAHHQYAMVIQFGGGKVIIYGDSSLRGLLILVSCELG